MILCDHASNRIPEPYQSFGFAEDALQTHIAWDPGALAGGAASYRRSWTRRFSGLTPRA